MAPSFNGGDHSLFRHKSAGFQEMVHNKEEAVKMVQDSHGWAQNIMLMIELRKKILVLRDYIDLPPCDQSAALHQLVMITAEDLRKLCPNVVFDPVPETAQTSIHQGLFHLYGALEMVRNVWARNNKRISDFREAMEESTLENLTLDQLGGRVLRRVNHMINLVKEMLDMMDDDAGNYENNIKGSIFGENIDESYSQSKITCPSPDTPAKYTPLEFDIIMKPQKFADMSYSPSLLLPLRIQAVNKLKPFDMKWSFSTLPHASSTHHEKAVDKPNGKGSDVEEPKNVSSCLAAVITSPPQPPPPQIISNMTVAPPRPPPPPVPYLTGYPAPTPPLALGKGVEAIPPPPLPPGRGTGAAAPPPPPSGMAKALRTKKAATKLKRSAQMGKLYRTLKGKVEGGHSNGNSSQGKRTKIGGGSSGGKQGMADALAEMTKRSAYFQQIEEDVQTYGSMIMETKSAISNFKTKDMAELLKFHRHVEQNLEKLTDETQVLARFDGFPTKKLEAIRTAAALYSKLDGIATELKNWKIVPPLKELLVKTESYFNKIKGEIDALERSKDEEMKRFRSQNIEFDFNILVRIKESMVDVSSGCMELALEERRETKAAAGEENGSNKKKTRACVRMLWQAFQLAFRVYNFAGGQDDRADHLTQKLAKEIEADPSSPKN